MIIHRRFYRRRIHTCSNSAPLLNFIHFPALRSACQTDLFVRFLVDVDFAIDSCLKLVDIGQRGTKEKQQQEVGGREGSEGMFTDAYPCRYA